MGNSEENRKKYETFRKAYPEFIYDSYQIQETEDGLAVTYHFRIPGLSEFAPSWRFKKAAESGGKMIFGKGSGEREGSPDIEEKNTGGNDPGEKDPGDRGIDAGLLEKMVFSLGMVELVSYWKITCSPRVTVKAGPLSREQVRWWKNLYFNGLGEFFYVNHIREAVEEDFMELSSCVPGKEGAVRAVTEMAAAEGVPKVLVPIGGGKDSAVTLELLKEAGAERFGYVINPRGAAVHTAKAAGLSGEQVISVKRTLDKRMLELNRQGFLNGHTPFSAIVAFSSLIAAYLNHLPYIALSNESSANESTVPGSTVNHQYSKSFQFERDFHEYAKKYLPGSGYYFSMLRPLSEFQIAGYFAGLRQYHKVFRSCNVGSKEDIWCGHCPKCLFVYLILSPFLSSRELEEIFGRNLLEDESLYGTLKQLTGLLEEKPFECVGSRSEVNTAITLAIQKAEAEGRDLPRLFKLYRDFGLYEQYRQAGDRYSGYFDEENLVPEPWKELVKNNCCGRKY